MMGADDGIHCWLGLGDTPTVVSNISGSCDGPADTANETTEGPAVCCGKAEMGATKKFVG